MMTADELKAMKADADLVSEFSSPLARKVAAHCHRLLAEREQYDKLASDVEAETDELHNRASALAQENRQLRAEAICLGHERDKLKEFKEYVHRRLDEAGVTVDPESVHKEKGCRIGGRLDEVFAERDRLRAACQATVAAHDTLFAQCLSNPIHNAWGKPVDVTAFNEAYSACRAALIVFPQQPVPPTQPVSVALAQACAQRDAYRERVAVLEAVIRPFAIYAGTVQGISTSDSRPLDSVFPTSPTVGDLRRARDVLYAPIGELAQPAAQPDPAPVAFEVLSTNPPVVFLTGPANAHDPAEGA